MRFRLLCSVPLSVLLATSALAQTPRQTVTITASAPVFVSPNENQPPLRVAREGSVLLLIGTTAEWTHVEFEDPEFGRRIGYVQTRFVRINSTAGAPSPTTLTPPQQAPAPPPTPPTPSGGPTPPTLRERARGGFTILVNAGVGFQTDTVLEDSATGLAGLNLGVGGFLNENVALLFRISGTNVTYEDTFFELNQVSGVVGATVQFWPSDRFTLEAGGGAGFWNLGDESESGPGLVLGAGVVLLDHRRHKLHFGAEYAPAFPDAGTVHNLGLTIGYQYHR